MVFAGMYDSFASVCHRFQPANASRDAKTNKYRKCFLIRRRAYLRYSRFCRPVMNVSTVHDRSSSLSTRNETAIDLSRVTDRWIISQKHTSRILSFRRLDQSIEERGRMVM